MAENTVVYYGNGVLTTAGAVINNGVLSHL